MEPSKNKKNPFLLGNSSSSSSSSLSEKNSASNSATANPNSRTVVTVAVAMVVVMFAAGMVFFMLGQGQASPQTDETQPLQYQTGQSTTPAKVDDELNKMLEAIDKLENELKNASNEKQDSIVKSLMKTNQ